MLQATVKNIIEKYESNPLWKSTLIHLQTVSAKCQPAHSAHAGMDRNYFANYNFSMLKDHYSSSSMIIYLTCG